MDNHTANMTPNQFELIKELNIICSENGFWMFMAIQSSVFQTVNSCVILDQIDKFSDTWCNLFGKYYNQNYVNSLKVNISNFFDIYLSYLNVMTNGKNENPESLFNQWKQLTNVLAKNFADLNPYWKEAEWRSIISNQINILDKEIKNNTQGVYSTLDQSYNIYNRVQTDIAEYFAAGLIKQFSI